MTNPRILIVEDDEMMSALLAAVLTNSGYEPHLAHSALDMAEQLTKQSYSAIVLDLGLPDEDGIVLVRKLRSTSQVPILVLTARKDLDDRLVALDLGVDHYLTKPCDPEEIVLRIRNLLRRTGDDTEQDSTLPLGNHAINLHSRTIEDGEGNEIALTRGEFHVALALARAPNRVLSRAQLQDSLSAIDGDASPRSVDVLVARLRRKLGFDPRAGAIQTVPGIGYRLRQS
jgi:two-component system OmpR family response regulator